MRELIERLENLVESKDFDIEDFKKFKGTDFEDIGIELKSEIRKALVTLSLEDCRQVFSTMDYISDGLEDVTEFNDKLSNLRDLAKSMSDHIHKTLHQTKVIGEFLLYSSGRKFEPKQAEKDLKFIKSKLGLR